MIQERYKKEITDLKTAYNSGKLNLYLGAGISIDSGLPSWRQLVVSMYFRYMASEQWDKIKPYPNYLYSIGQWYLNKTGESLDIIIRKLKSDLEDDQFNKFLYECLYNPLNERFIENVYESRSSNNQSLNEVALLINNKKINSIITYNFDDLLESVLLKKKFKNFTTVF